MRGALGPFQTSNLMQMRKIYCCRSFALDSAHEKFDIWNGTYAHANDLSINHGRNRALW